MTNEERDRIEELKNRRLARQKRQKRRNRRIMFLFVVAIVIILAIVLAVKGITNVVIHSSPAPTATPIPIVDESGEPVATQTPEESETTPIEDAENPTDAPEPTSALPQAEEQNDILKFLESTASEKKVCYLTFDDGPTTSITPKILDTLRKYDIKATFFEVGSLIKANPDMARRVYEEGHLIAGHSYSHTYSKLYATADSFTEEIKNCEEQIKSIVGNDFFPLIRFPGGSYNAGTYGERKQQYKEVLAQMGYYHTDWNCLNGDAEGGSKSVEQLIERVKSTSKNKNQIVVLMHDAANKKNTAEALPQIIEYLIAEGYSFARLDKPVY